MAVLSKTTIIGVLAETRFGRLPNLNKEISYLLLHELPHVYEVD